MVHTSQLLDKQFFNTTTLDSNSCYHLVVAATSSHDSTRDDTTQHRLKLFKLDASVVLNNNRSHLFNSFSVLKTSIEMRSKFAKQTIIECSCFSLWLFIAAPWQGGYQCGLPILNQQPAQQR